VGKGEHRGLDVLARCHFFGRGLAENRSEAARLWRLAAEAGVATAMFAHGLCLYSGEGVAVDQGEAIVRFRAAAEQGVSGAMFMLGQCHVFGAGVPIDRAAGIEWYRRAAEAGSREAAYELGEIHASGRDGRRLDLHEALRWWRHAGRLGHARASLKIAHCYRWGDAVAEDPALALAWYRRAASAGDIHANVWLGECLEFGMGVVADPAAAIDHYRSAAGAGDPHGLAELGRCLLHGIGVSADPAQGEAMLRSAAEAGWSSAFGELERYWFARGERLFNCGSVRVEEAVHCYRKAAELGHRRAALMLAECLRHGVGGVPDLPQAVIWYRKAAALFDAKIALGDMYFFGWGVAKSEREALRWYEQAVAQHEDAYAMYSLGYCLLHGRGTRRDPEAGLRWLNRSAELGEIDAQYELGSAHYRGNNRGLAMKWLRSAASLGHARAQAFLERMTRGDSRSLN
jgi:TPR repeat protein